MTSDAEVIAMLLPEDAGVQIASGASGEPRATLLVRESDGRVMLETVAASSLRGRLAQTLGCFRRRSPIIDPISRQVMGYELEMVPSPAT
ncbi:MAG TPA: hypothetical protein VLT59_15715 [Steroidobacteraceae bacterium]|nr:hypothetical protein [Steroidobacteraceae bacterium]